MDIIKFYEEQVEYEKEQIKFADGQIAFANKMLKGQREQDRDLVKFVWGRGVVERWEMEHYTKDYKSDDTKYWEKDRRYWYRMRKHDRERLQYWESQLAQRKS